MQGVTTNRRDAGDRDSFETIRETLDDAVARAPGATARQPKRFGAKHLWLAVMYREA